MSLHRLFATVLCASFVYSVPTTGMSTDNMKKFGIGVMAFVVTEALRFGFREACIKGGAQLSKSKFGQTSDEKRAAGTYATVFGINTKKPNLMDFIKIPVKALGIENIVLALFFKSPEWYILGATTDIVKGLVLHGVTMITSNMITRQLDEVCGPGNCMTSQGENRLDSGVILGSCIIDIIRFGIKMTLSAYVTKHVMPASVLRKFNAHFLTVAAKIGIAKWFKTR